MTETGNGSGGQENRSLLMNSDWANRPIGQTLMGLTFTLAAIPIILQLIASLLERPYTIYIDADTEILRLTTQDLSITPWYIEDAKLVNYQTSTQEKFFHSHNTSKSISEENPIIEIDLNSRNTKELYFQGYLEIEPHSDVTLTRRGAGQLQIDIASINHDSQTAVMLTPIDCKEYHIASLSSNSHCKTVRSKINQSHILAPMLLEKATIIVSIPKAPFNATLIGNGRIGDDPFQPTTPSSPPLLRSGEVSIVGRRLLSEQVYTLMSSPLHLGDTLRVTRDTNSKGESETIFTCLFSIVNAELGGNGINLACHASGNLLDIGRYGDNSRRDMAPRPWDLLINEPLMQITLPIAITGIFILFLRLLDKYYSKIIQKAKNILRIPEATTTVD